MSDGPWRVDKYVGRWVVEREHPNRVDSFYDVSLEDKAIARCAELNKIARREAASGELLAACKAVVKATGSSEFWDGETKRFLQMCEAAIRAAEGGEVGR